MSEQKWIQTLSQFQAQYRGCVMRRGLSLVRAQFEDIVQEIDGGLDHLQWRGNIIPRPHFTDTESLLLRYERSRFQCHDRLDHSEREQNEEKFLPQSDIHVPEKDKAPEAADRETSHVDDVEDKIGDIMVIQNLTDDCATLCSDLNSDVRLSSLFQTAGPGLHSLLKDTTHTPESLKQQRSTLAMELLWIQQAISSRKKYLTLKQRMDASH
ncbi:IQ domain-containing protein C [Danio aesculapii]|uniref:IQ domain-containing protein C n=1 Tax=Danio aesculapii TaxID=1142201 RepID=UPI0024BFE78A|nr:IQ domain-containing protein C [Danio aesculapii]